LPLSTQAVAQIASIIETSDAGSPLLFPGNKPGQPLHDIKKFWSVVMGKAGIRSYRRHDNRHTRLARVSATEVGIWGLIEIKNLTNGGMIRRRTAEVA
jgi:hypothetical protein